MARASRTCRAYSDGSAAAVAPCAHGHYGVVHAVEDNQDGSYVVTYSVAISGKYALQLTIGGQHIMGSPFRLVVAGAEASGGEVATATDIVRDALDVGYRFLDCAQFYGNEVQVGEAIKTSKVPRSGLAIAPYRNPRVQVYR